jgi:uncharacterized membrane protein YjgN (DUF898 family)
VNSPGGEPAAAGTSPRSEAILDPVDRVSEIMFGLLMALSFTGALSVASAGQEDVRTMMAAALGCNLAWGLVDAVMYLVRDQVDRGHRLAQLRAVREAPDDRSANARIEAALPAGWAKALTPAMVDTLRRHVRALPEPPMRPGLQGRTLAGAASVFALVVAATFPVVVPFMLIEDMRFALRVSNGVAVAMLFGAGFQLGRHAGVGGVRTGLWMVALGVVMVGAIMLFGG